MGGSAAVAASPGAGPNQDERRAALIVIERTVLAGWRVALVVGCLGLVVAPRLVPASATEGALSHHTDATTTATWGTWLAVALVWMLTSLTFGIPEVLYWVDLALRRGPGAVRARMDRWAGPIGRECARRNARESALWITREAWWLLAACGGGGSFYRLLCEAGTGAILGAVWLVGSAMAAGTVLSWYGLVLPWLWRHHRLALPWRECVHAWSPLLIAREIAGRQLRDVRTIWGMAFGRRGRGDKH